MNKKFNCANVHMKDGVLTIQPGYTSIDSGLFDVTFDVHDGVATVTGKRERWGIHGVLGTQVKIEDADDKYIRTKKTWFGLGKEVRVVEDGWVKLKGRDSITYSSNNYCLIED